MSYFNTQDLKNNVVNSLRMISDMQHDIDMQEARLIRIRRKIEEMTSSEPDATDD